MTHWPRGYDDKVRASLLPEIDDYVGNRDDDGFLFPIVTTDLVRAPLLPEVEEYVPAVSPSEFEPIPASHDFLATEDGDAVWDDESLLEV